MKLFSTEYLVVRMKPTALLHIKQSIYTGNLCSVLHKMSIEKRPNKVNTLNILYILSEKKLKRQKNLEVIINSFNVRTPHQVDHASLGLASVC